MHIRLKKESFAEIILILSLFAVGLFYEGLSCAAALAMLVWIIIQLVKKSELKIYLNLTGVSVAAIVLFYLVTAIWAVDSGMALIGFVKFLPVLLFLFIIMQQKQVDNILKALPVAATVMVVISAVAMQIPAVSTFFAVDGRLAGFFQYPNTFALFLIVAELVVFAKEKHKISDYLLLAVLVFGILYSGSRTAFVLFILSNAVLLFKVKDKPFKIFAIVAAVVAVAAAVLFFVISGNVSAFNRFLTISLTDSSTFSGRLLYFKDALPVILKHPFGLGFMGWFFIQGSVQTGVYSVMYIHNEFLQLLLDIGWLPCGLLIAAIVKSLFSKNVAFYKKVVLCTIVLHSCFDFNLQFVSLFFVLLLFMDYNSGKEISLKNGRNFVIIAAVLLSGISIYFGSSLVFYQLGKYDVSHKIYPLNTQNEIYLMQNEEDLDQAAKIADKITAKNQYAAAAYSVKARNAYNSGDFQKVIQIKKKIFSLSPFNYSEYEEYCYMLINGIMLYHNAGDYSSESVCRSELIAVYDEFKSLPNRLSALGTKIQDQPETQLPQEVEDYVSVLKSAE